ncbi:hypothetical protein ALC53_10573 [Atta colombica]|uniref:Uncharacterized protein n=1 Tax=Atta colombica TaxID=520822 RepID=A0A195B484_9HYME|nr:hypothetical protein ALC53_10573 [Atta colombica]
MGIPDTGETSIGRKRDAAEWDEMERDELSYTLRCKASRRPSFIIFNRGTNTIYEKLNTDLGLYLKILRKEKNKIIHYINNFLSLNFFTYFRRVNIFLAEVALHITFLSLIRIQITILNRVKWEEIPNSIISYKPLEGSLTDYHLVFMVFSPPRPRTFPLALAVVAAGADTAYTGTEGKKIGETRKGANERRGQRAIGDRGKQLRTWYPRVYLRTMRKLNAVFQEDWIAWLHVNREEEEQEEGEEEEEEEEEEQEEKTKNGIAGATTEAGVGLPLLLLVVALLDDLTHVTAASVILEPLNSVYLADVPTPVYLPPRSSDYYLFAPRPFRRAIKRAFNPNDVDSEDLSNLTPSRDNEGIVARRGRAKRVAISKRSKLKDQPSPNFIDSWPEAWRRANEHPPQSRKVEPRLSIDERIRPAVQTFTPLLEPVFKLGGSILRSESSLRDILFRESASKTTTTTTTAVATRTITRNIVYFDATQHAKSTVPEKNDVERVTEDRVEGDKREKELVLVGNEDNSAIVVGGDSVIEWTTTTVAGPMSSSRSAFSGDNVQVAERVRVRASSERSSSKGEQDDEEQRSTGQFPSVLGWLYRLHVRTYISGIRGWRQPPCNIRHPSGHGPYAIAFPHCVVSLIIIKQFFLKCRYHS